MTAPSSIDPARFLHEQLAQASPDLLRQMLTTFINTLMSAEADAVCGAGWGERSAERTNSRNGYRSRQFDTRAGTLELAIPKLRAGSYFPDWLLECRRRAERADHRGRHLLPARRLDPADGEAGRVLGHHPLVEVAGQRDGEGPRRAGGPVPFLPPRCGALHLRRRRRAGAEGPGGRPSGQRARAGGHRRQWRRAPGDPRPAGHQRRGRRRLAGVLPGT